MEKFYNIQRMSDQKYLVNSFDWEDEDIQWSLDPLFARKFQTEDEIYEFVNTTTQLSHGDFLILTGFSTF